MPGLGSAATVAVTSTDLPHCVRMDSASTSASTHANGVPKLDPSDPRVRKLVYSMYRDMLTTYNGEANDIISKKDPTKVTQDSGVGPILESIVKKQRGTQGGGSELTDPPENLTEPDSVTTNETVAMPPPPPPPPMMSGSLPSVRLTSEIGPRDKGPPAAIASAMMKDKKPFTYTPGGIDLSEIRSPRMAKRIQMNALAEGVTNTPKPSASNQERPPCNLPPAAIAAMQPQMAIPVFPQGNISAVQLNRKQKPVDFAGPPPPPPPMPAQIPQPPVASMLSPQPFIQPVSLPSPPAPKSPPSPPAPPVIRTPPPTIRSPPPPPERASTPKSPVPPTDSRLGDARPSSQSSAQDERRSPVGRKSPLVEAATGVGTGCIYIPPIQSPVSPPAPPPPPPSHFMTPMSPMSPISPPQQMMSPISPPQHTMSPMSQPAHHTMPVSPPMPSYTPLSSRPAGQTKAQAVSQSIGTIYIPPIGPQDDKVEFVPNTGGYSNENYNVSRTPMSAQAASTPQTASVPPTPQLNRAPIPWMNSYNRMQNQQADSPPYVHPGFFMPPWAAPSGPGARTIPIMMDQTDSSFQMQGQSDSRPSSAGSGSGSPSGSRTPSQAATHLGRVIPIQIEREEAVRQKGGKVIPIQIEGRPPKAQTPSTPTTPLMNPMRRAVGPAPYNSPMGLYSNQNAMDAYQRQAMNAAAGGIDRMTIRCESPRIEPAQSKSMRIIQQAAENELKRLDQQQQQRRMDMSQDDRSQVDEGASFHQIAEPRFMGANIPSKAFRALQTALPATGQDLLPPSIPAAQPGQVHHIPIRTVPQSPTPQSQVSEMHVSSQSHVPPSEQRVQEPRKYMGSNIPSRSFKILQAMTSDDGQSAVGSETAPSSEQIIADSYDDTISPCSSTETVPLSLSSSSSSSFPLSPSCSEAGGSAHIDPYAFSQNPWPDAIDQAWDPYTYMWYYWWYYASCYWAGYDMTGYEYPVGWDPNYPYCPPELFSDYSTLSEYASGSELDQCNLGDMNEVSSSETCAPDFQKTRQENVVESYYGYDNDSSRTPSHNNTRAAPVPKIVVDGYAGKEGKHRMNSEESIKDNKNSIYNDGSTISKTPTPSTEYNQKLGNPIACKKNDSDGDKNGIAWKAEHGHYINCKPIQNGNDDHEKGREEAEEDSSSEDEYESCCEDEEKVIEQETGPCNKPFVTPNPDHFSSTEQQSHQRKFKFQGNYNCELNANSHHDKDEDEGKGDTEEDDDDEDDKTDPGTDDDDDDYGSRVAIIEEPDTPSSADDPDDSPLVNGNVQAGKSSFYSNGGLTIEEYHSEESSDSAVFDYGLKNNRLSTIDEITESRASSSMFSGNLSAEFDCCVNTSNLLLESPRLHQNDAFTAEDSEESSEDELSSVSVIENKSDATRATESKREDGTTSSSNKDSSTDDDDDDEAAGADTAVTVRLPLKLCFTKTKSYKDITTVMVGDSEIEKENTSEESCLKSLNEFDSSRHANDHIPKFAITADSDDDEPVVSFTLSLSRQPSREDDAKPKEKLNEGCSENDENTNDDAEPDIDFWAEIKGKEYTVSSIASTQNEIYEEDPKEDYNEESSEADIGFWGAIAKDRSTTDFHRMRRENEKQDESYQNDSLDEQISEHWDPEEKIDYKWEKDFNFWEKSSRTIETRRFSNFQITEDYESDSGIKPSVKKDRPKKYTHHKRHSIPGPGWDRSTLPPRPAQKQSTCTAQPRETPNEQEITEEKVSNFDSTSGHQSESKEKTSLGKQTLDSYQEETDASSWWSYWDEMSTKREERLKNDEDCTSTADKIEAGASGYKESWMEDTITSQKREESLATSVEKKLSETENKVESTDDDYQSFTSMQESRMEAGGNEGFSSLERKDGNVKSRKSLNHSCQSDATTVTTDSEHYSSSPNTNFSLLFSSAANHETEKLIQGSCISVSDENSDESSSRSSRTTIGRHDKNEIKSPAPTPILPPTAEVPADSKADSESHLKSSEDTTPSVDTSIQIPVSIERNDEFHHELGETLILNGKQQQDEHHHHPTTSAINTTSCTCFVGDRIARAENLLWRIERFLHESLSLGSEDDSGVMTDLSRQISDVDTDVDNDLNDTEFLLTAAAAAKQRRLVKETQHIESCNFAQTISSTHSPLNPAHQPSTSPVSNTTPQVKPRPKSDIILESSLTQVETEMVDEKNGVKMRSASERRALRYQRAKTHSRLFQLLQDECGRDDEPDDFDYDSDIGTPTMGGVIAMADVGGCQISMESTTMTTSHGLGCTNGMDDDRNDATSPKLNDAQARRSRLLPLPIKNLLASSLSLDSNSSPSGSSGVLSPTSPVNRDQLLADIINEFHCRNQASTLRAQSQKRISNSFPSKVFKLLQHEFGEEFYQTFDCCKGVSEDDSLISPFMSTNFCVNESNCHAAGSTAGLSECTIHKSESLKEFEEATNRILTNFMLRNKQKSNGCQSPCESPSCTATMSSQMLQDDSRKTSADFLEVPMRKKKGNFNRDPRSPKSTKKS